MKDIFYFDRRLNQIQTEKVYGRWALSLMYGRSVVSRLFAFVFLPIISRLPIFSRFFAFLQTRSGSSKKIAPFIADYSIDTSEFLEPVSSFHSFNDFFIRKIKPDKRPIDPTHAVVMPVDGRYLAIPDISQTDGFYVKGERFDLEAFLQDSALARRFRSGSMVIARLCPSDYHRVHFPVDGVPSEARLVAGPLFSVSPVALAKRFSILWENKRMITTIATRECGLVCLVEIGATFVGSIYQTYTPHQPVKKGDEKSYFSFGGSSVALLFERNRVQFDLDLLEHSAQFLETRGLFGDSLANSRQMGHFD